MLFLVFLMSLNFFVHPASAWEAPVEQFYRIHIPATSQSCEKEAQLLAGKFQQQSKISVLSAKCSAVVSFKADNTDYTLYALDLTYNYPQNIKNFKIYSSYYGGSGFSRQTNNRIGFYSTFESCLNDLTYRTLEFSLNTGAVVLVSTCEKALSKYEDSYVLRIDTIGVPVTKLHSTDTLSSNFRGTALQDAVQKMVRFNGGKIVGQNKGYIYYYATKAVEPIYQSFGHMTHEACVDQLPNLAKMFANFNPGEISLGCIPSEYAPDERQNLMAVWNHFAMFNHITQPEKYYSYQECKNDKSRVLESYQKRGLKIHNALCEVDGWSSDANIYVMTVFQDLSF